MTEQEELMQLCKEFWASDIGKAALRKSRDRESRQNAKVEAQKRELNEQDSIDEQDKPLDNIIDNSQSKDSSIKPEDNAKNPLDSKPGTA